MHTSILVDFELEVTRIIDAAMNPLAAPSSGSHPCHTMATIEPWSRRVDRDLSPILSDDAFINQTRKSEPKLGSDLPLIQKPPCSSCFLKAESLRIVKTFSVSVSWDCSIISIVVGSIRLFCSDESTKLVIVSSGND